MKITGMTFVADGKHYTVTSEARQAVYGSAFMVADCKSENSKLEVVFKKIEFDEESNSYIPVLKSATLMLWCKVELKMP